MMNQTEVTIKNVGPIIQARIACPKGGGVVLLRGRNGVGKSMALDAVNALLTGRGDVPVRDGQASASVEGFGAILKVGARTKRLGELEVLALEGKFNAGTLVNPELKDPIAADMARIKAILSVAKLGAEIDPWLELFASPAELERLCPKVLDEAEGDVLKLAMLIKRRLESEARKHEGIHQEHIDHAKAIRESIGAQEITGESDELVLQTGLTEAVRRHQDLVTRKKAHDDAVQAHQFAQRRLAEVEATDATPLATLRQKHAAQVLAVEGLRRRRDELEAQRIALNADLDQAGTMLDGLAGQLQQAESREKALEGYRATVEGQLPEGVTPEQIEEANAAIQNSRKAIEHGAFIRKAKADWERRTEHLDTAAFHEREAARLRAAAAGTDGVLSSLVASLGIKLRIVKGRLVLDTDRGEELFEELSQGEKWKQAIDLVVDVVGSTGVVVIDQTAWEGMATAVRDEIANHAARRGVIVMCALISDGAELTSEIYEPQKGGDGT